jgi:hypothetical protein
MNPLTLEYSLEKKFTPNDLVRYFKPELTDKECDWYLWERTCYPFDLKTTIEQLNTIFLCQ